jgi:hypothetical protein
MRQLMVLVAGLLLMAGCAATPATEMHTVSFQLETVNPTAYTDMTAEYAMWPLAEEKAKTYDKSWKTDVTIHYPDVERVSLTGRLELNDDVLFPDPAAQTAKLQCQIWVDDVLVAQNVGTAPTCVHIMTAGKQALLAQS